MSPSFALESDIGRMDPIYLSCSDAVPDVTVRNSYGLHESNCAKRDERVYAEGQKRLGG